MRRVPVQNVAILCLFTLSDGQDGATRSAERARVPGAGPLIPHSRAFLPDHARRRRRPRPRGGTLHGAASAARAPQIRALMPVVAGRRRTRRASVPHSPRCDAGSTTSPAPGDAGVPHLERDFVPPRTRARACVARLGLKRRVGEGPVGCCDDMSWNKRSRAPATAQGSML